MLKKEARQLFRKKRNALTHAERVKLDDLLLIQFQALDLPYVQILLTYWPIEKNKEPNTHLFTRYLAFRYPELQVAYPRSDFGRNEMKAVLVKEDSHFARNEYHIYEPAGGEIIPADEPDMIFVPLLAFDNSGYRVGYGKGFYDKYLSYCREDCLKVGFSYFPPVDVIDDCDDFDVPLDLCITPQAVYVF